MTAAPVGLVGVYHADGGPIGEARYVIGRLLGTAHCSLCDITHGVVRRKAKWDAMAAGLGLPVDLVHLNEMPIDIAPLVAERGSPLVAARLEDGTAQVVLAPEDLDALSGSVDEFAVVLRAQLAVVGGGGVTM